MLKTVESIKALYKALGGDEADIAGCVTIPQCIDKITAFVTAGGLNQLPVVSASDNGKVLKVVSGEWAAGTDNT